MFQFIDADEGRVVNDKHINCYSRPKYVTAPIFNYAPALNE